MIPDSNIVPFYGRMVITRRGSLPHVENQGNLTPLQIPRRAGLAEITHFIYFSDQQIIGVEFNFYGPRPTRIADYLAEKARGDIDSIELTPILRLDFEERINRIGQITFMEIEVSRNAVQVVRDLNESLGRAFQAASEASDAEVLQIILKKKKYARDGFRFDFLLDKFRQVFGNAEMREAFNKFKIRAQNTSTGEPDTFDFLADKLIVSKTVELENQRNRMVNSTDMYRAIISAYEDIREQLLIRV